MNLVVDEGKASDEVIVTVKSRLDKVLRVVTDELKEGKHGKTSVLKLSGLTLGKDIIGQVKNSGRGGEPSVGLNASNEGDDLHPSKEGDGVNSGDTVGDVAGAQTIGGEVISETVGLRGDVSEDGKLGDTSVLELSKTVGIEGLLGDTVRKTGGVPESNGGKGTDLSLESVEGGSGLGHRDRGKGGGGASHGSEDSDLHHGCS